MIVRPWIAVCCLISLAMVTAVAARAEDPKGDDRVPVSGFLGDYSELQPAAKDDDMLVYRKHPGVLGEYDKFIVDPVLVYFHPEAKGVGVDPAKLQELAEYARAELVAALQQGGYEVVEEPGPGVAWIRAAITDVDVAKTGANTGAKAAGMAVGVGFLVPSVDVGGASMEAEIRDSETGERLVAIVDRERGRRFFNMKGMKKMGDAKKAFREWSKTLRQRLDKAHGKS